MSALSSGSLHQAGEDAVGLEPGFRSSSERYFAEDHQKSERLFRVIIGGRDAGAAEEGKEKFLVGPCEISPEGFSGFEAKGLLADMIQFPDGAFFDVGRRLPGEIARFELLSHLAES